MELQNKISVKDETLKEFDSLGPGIMLSMSIAVLVGLIMLKLVTLIIDCRDKIKVIARSH